MDYLSCLLWWGEVNDTLGGKASWWYFSKMAREQLWQSLTFQREPLTTNECGGRSRWEWLWWVVGFLPSVLDIQAGDVQDTWNNCSLWLFTFSPWKTVIFPLVNSSLSHHQACCSIRIRFSIPLSTLRVCRWPRPTQVTRSIVMSKSGQITVRL